MNVTRREWLVGASGVLAGLVQGPNVRAAATRPAKVGSLKVAMCDWSMGRRDPGAFELAKQIGLDGVQVSVGDAANRLWLRQPKVQEAYRAAVKGSGLAIASLAMGVLNDVPLMSEPRAALWVADAIEVARSLGVRVILLAFFGKGELREDRPDDGRRVTEVLQELAPRAERAGVVLAIESYLSAEGHLAILDAVKSDAVQVYYDVYNSHVSKGYDFVAEIKRLGRRRIAEVHVKESNVLLKAGRVRWPEVADLLREIGYDGWIVLETSSPSGNVVEDTRRNVEYVRSLFTA